MIGVRCPWAMYLCAFCRSEGVHGHAIILATTNGGGNWLACADHAAAAIDEALAAILKGEHERDGALVLRIELNSRGRLHPGRVVFVAHRRVEVH